MPTTPPLALLGVPSSLAAHWPGQEKAPEALRAAGVIDRISETGRQLVDMGDLPVRRHRPDLERRQAQNLPDVVCHLREVAEQVATIAGRGMTPLVIGGECSTTIGVVSGLLAHDPAELALLYIDGGYDLFTPVTNPEGILDSMGVGHMIDEPGAAPELSRIGPRTPLLSDRQVVFFGQDQGYPGDPEQGVLNRRGMRHFPASSVRGQEARSAAEALAHLETIAPRFLVHFDVDVIDFVDLPVADVPQFNSGLTLESAMTALRIFLASPACAGLVITEFNPDHADPEGDDARRFVDRLAGAFQPPVAAAREYADLLGFK